MKTLKEGNCDWSKYYGTCSVCGTQVQAEGSELMYTMGKDGIVESGLIPCPVCFKSKSASPDIPVSVRCELGGATKSATKSVTKDGTFYIRCELGSDMIKEQIMRHLSELQECFVITPFSIKRLQADWKKAEQQYAEEVEAMEAEVESVVERVVDRCIP